MPRFTPSSARPSTANLQEIRSDSDNFTIIRSNRTTIDESTHSTQRFLCGKCGRFFNNSASHAQHGIVAHRLTRDLFQAAIHGFVDRVEYHLSAGADINGKCGKHGSKNALMLAALHGNTAVLHHLIHAGADLNQVDDYGRSALGYAISSFSLASFSTQKDMVIALLQAGANPLIGSDHPPPIIQTAALKGDVEFAEQCMTLGVKLLPWKRLKYGRDISYETRVEFDKLVRTPLPLERLASLVIKSQVSKENIAELPLPTIIKEKYLM